MRPDKMILTAGPSISQKEIDYVMDAVKNGWNFNFSDYVEKFEDALSKYTGAKYALGTTNGTSGLHLSMRLFGVGPGDEVILPDMTYVACANVIEYMGAVPVFADIDSDTWCIDPEDIERKITKRTKAVMPVWMYGNAPDMDRIMAIARAHGLYVVEDSCPALGSFYQNRSAGSIGDTASFSLQGAKIVATGEGGAFVTSNPIFHDRAKSLYDHGRDFGRQFWVHEYGGYMYKMSNLHAALALAQLERVEEFVAKKRELFSWYTEGLNDVDCLVLNKPLPNTLSNMWMSSFVLKSNSPVTREALRAKLKERMIDTRPFFYPISMFPMYASRKFNNPNAYRVALNGINLPSGVERTEEEVVYICEQVKEILEAR